MPPEDAQAWHEPDGRLIAYGWSQGPTRWMRFAGLAAYRFTDDATEVTAVAEPGAPLEWITDTFERSVLPFVLQLRGYEALHAGAACVDGGVVALCAVSGTGKSTLAFALDRAGFPQWSDDSVLIDPRDPFPAAIALPCRVRLRPASAHYFAVSEAVIPARRPEPGLRRPLSCVMVLKQTPAAAGGSVEVERLCPGDALHALLTNAYCFDVRDSERKALMVKNYLALLGRVPVLSITFASGLERVPAIVQAVVAAATSEAA